jgi:hypothetical protein
LDYKKKDPFAMSIFCRFCGQTPPVPAQCENSGDGKHHFQQFETSNAGSAPPSKDLVINPKDVFDTAYALRVACGDRESGHMWQIVGCNLQEQVKSPNMQAAPICIVIRVCFDCSSFTYHTMKFIGERDDTLEDRIVDHMRGETAGLSTPEKTKELGEQDGPSCEKCSEHNFRRSDRFDDIRVCIECEHPQLWRKAGKQKTANHE